MKKFLLGGIAFAAIAATLSWDMILQWVIKSSADDGLHLSLPVAPQ